jgi:hypothetical protein
MSRGVGTIGPALGLPLPLLELLDGLVLLPVLGWLLGDLQAGGGVPYSIPRRRFIRSLSFSCGILSYLLCSGCSPLSYG